MFTSLKKTPQKQKFFKTPLDWLLVYIYIKNMIDIQKHEPVLLNETLKFLDPQPNQNFIDCTIGGGGHSKAILSLSVPNGRILGIDKDKMAIENAEDNLKKYKSRYMLVKENFVNLKKIVLKYKFFDVDGILLDLGMSTIQLSDDKRGFSFIKDAPLDMRMDQEGKLTAANIVNKWSEVDLIKIFKDYGEERYARKIAKAIVSKREKETITGSLQLVEIIKEVKFYDRKHPATKVFQALRIAVNEELNNLKNVLPDCLSILKSKGKITVISFHSMEDRIVKSFFKKESIDCICPPKTLVCRCGHKAKLKILTKKPITATNQEIEQNPKSRSAKLRVAEKI